MNQSLSPVVIGLLAFAVAQACSLQKLDPINYGNGGSGGEQDNGGSAGDDAMGGNSSKGGTTSKGGTSAKGGSSSKASSSAKGGGGSQGGTGSAATDSTSGGTAAGGTTGSVGTTSVASGRSCVGLTTTCQSCTSEKVCGTAESCCTSLAVPTGTFLMGRSQSNGATDYYTGTGTSADELPAHSVTLDGFALDKYEVTVGRFRQFVLGYDAWYAAIATNLAAGAGAHSKITGSGWNQSWTSNLPTSAALLKDNLKCSSMYQNWTDDALTHETLPVNCVNWFEAMAFCIWDGGYLPTEAEWEYAAAGGDKERFYPWGATTPDATLANFSEVGAYSAASCLAVGSKTDGRGRWLHEDLAGNVAEWTLDWYSSSWYSVAAATGVDPANLNAATNRVHRGGSSGGNLDSLRVARRVSGLPTARYPALGIRCAHPAQ